MDGFDRHTVGSHPKAHSCRSCEGRRSRTTLERSARGFERNFVGLANRCALEGSALFLSAVSNCSSQISALAQAGSDGGNPERARRGLTTTGWLGFEGKLRGWDVCSRQKGGDGIGPTKRGKGLKIMAVTDGNGLPIALRTTSASPAEVRLVIPTLEERHLGELPERMIGDKAYDSDGLDAELVALGIEMISPHRAGRRNDRITQDGRSLRRYKRRWKIERFFAWLNNYRRLCIRWEYHWQNYLAFLQLAASLIILRHL